MGLDFGLIIETLPRLLDGIGLTIAILLCSQLGGFVLAGFICAALLSKRRVFRAPARAYVTFFRGTPALVQLFIIYYGLAQFEFIRSSPLWYLLERSLLVLRPCLCHELWCLWGGDYARRPIGRTRRA